MVKVPNSDHNDMQPKDLKKQPIFEQFAWRRAFWMYCTAAYQAHPGFRLHPAALSETDKVELAALRKRRDLANQRLSMLTCTPAWRTLRGKSMSDTNDAVKKASEDMCFLKQQLCRAHNVGFEVEREAVNVVFNGVPRRLQGRQTDNFDQLVPLLNGHEAAAYKNADAVLKAARGAHAVPFTERVYAEQAQEINAIARWCSTSTAWTRKPAKPPRHGRRAPKKAAPKPKLPTQQAQEASLLQMALSWAVDGTVEGRVLNQAEMHGLRNSVRRLWGACAEERLMQLMDTETGTVKTLTDDEDYYAGQVVAFVADGTMPAAEDPE